MLTHKEWANGGRYESRFARGGPTNPALDTNGPNGWKSQPFGPLVSYIDKTGRAGSAPAAPVGALVSRR